jgi:hypothetical protein
MIPSSIHFQQGQEAHSQEQNEGNKGTTGNILTIGVQTSGNSLREMVGSRYILPNHRSTEKVEPTIKSNPTLMMANVARTANRGLSICLTPFPEEDSPWGKKQSPQAGSGENLLCQKRSIFISI